MLSPQIGIVVYGFEAERRVMLIVNLLGIKLKVFVRTSTDVMRFSAPHPNFTLTAQSRVLAQISIQTQV